jgi:phosphopantetheinyl transferase
MNETAGFIARAEEAAGRGLPLVLVAPPLAAAARLDLHRRMIAAFAGLPPETIPLASDAADAPLPFVRAGREALHLSRSIAGGCTALALATQPVGIDVALEDGGPIPFAALSVPERQDLAVCATETERRRLFLRIWTAKEAYLKALGTGLQRDPASIAVMTNQGGHLRIVDPSAPNASRRAQLSIWDDGALPVLPTGAVLCLCVIA